MAIRPTTGRSPPDTAKETKVPQKVNYAFQRAERERAKQAKKDAKAREKAEALPVEDKSSPEAAAPPKTED